MATDNFIDVWTKLKDLHEQEVRGLYTKLTEINMERCLDAQRLDELFSKNHQLREQHKIMNDNVKVLENRLRAGLCDRCTVTQELARKKQQEFETSQFQNLQHISVLTHEINGLKEENKLLHQELRKLKYFLQQSQSIPRGNCSLSDNSIPFESSLNNKRKQSLDAVLSPMSEQQRHKRDFRIPSQESFANPKRSPCHNLPELSFFDRHPQRISNQLHGTIAVVQTGSTSCCASEKDAASVEFGVKLQEQRHYEESQNWFKDCRRNEHSREKSNTIMEKQAEEEKGQTGLCTNTEGSGNGSGEKPLDLSDYSKNKEPPWSTYRNESSIQYESKKARFKEPLQKKCCRDSSARENSQDNMHSYETFATMVSVEPPSKDKDKTQDVLSPKDGLKMSDNEDKVFKNLNIEAQYDSTSKSRETDNNPRIKMKLCTKRPKTRNGGNPSVEVHLRFLNTQPDSHDPSECEADKFQEAHEIQGSKPENEKQQSQRSAGQPKKKKKKKPQDYWTSAAYKRGRRLRKCKLTQAVHTHSSQSNPKIPENKASSLSELISEGQN
ncbi:uncharacterized protein rbbp8l [Pristis pectinata]|uniref:uncharacterized protein rbbp8l n=1 Tax=Pristis pectinata TaxID=685728 RepID=UPI00223E0FE9|nr:uncharacterized protein rbbp8l [Pristis pectinata]XP_051887407.1 uncharacterized protein rbbp8l [Pristis pectinata]